MRFIIYGAGAVGGTIGAELFDHGHEVLLIARGAHYEAIKKSGLIFNTPGGSRTLPIPVVSHPDQITFCESDVVILTVKSQHTSATLQDLLAAAGPDIPLVCCQNGVNNEREALRLFTHVYAMVVMLPANHLEPGVVECNSANKSGVLDAGCYPNGTDDTITKVTQALDNANFSARADVSMMRWKYKKLLSNINNSLQAVCKMDADTDGISKMLFEEASAVFTAAGIALVSIEEEKQRYGDLIRIRPIAGKRRAGSSSWQSLANGKGDIESDYLNGEITLLGRLHGIATPANTVLQNLATLAARKGSKPGMYTSAEILSLIDERRE
jgi:2-dehydropantoate 2-reductase